MEPHAVLIYLKYAAEDLASISHSLSLLEEKILQALERTGAGELDGNEFGPDEVILFLYGKNADYLYESVRSILDDDPIGKFATTIVRYGGPGSTEKTIRDQA